MTKFTWFLLALLAVEVVLLVGVMRPQKAHAHSFYDYDCCHDKDCAPMPEGQVRETSEGYVFVPTGQVVPYGDRRIRQSPDGQWHVCTLAGVGSGAAILCIYVPGRGS